MKPHDHNKKPGTRELAKDGIPETAPQVMVVDGDPSCGSDLAGIARKLGYGVVAPVTDGAEALRISAVNPPDIAIVDLSLVGPVNGPALAGQLASLYGIRVILTASANDKNLLAAVKATKPYGWLPKPAGDREVGIALAIAGARHTADPADFAPLLPETEQKKHQVHLEAVIARRTADLKKTNSRLHRLLSYIELTERKLAADSLEMDIHPGSEIPPGIDEGVITADPGMKIVMINAPAARILGFSQGEAMGKEITGVFDIPDESVATSLTRSMKSMVSAGSPGETLEKVQVRSKSGRIQDLSVFYEPIFDGDDGIAGIILTFRDTEENKKKESETLRSQRLETLNLMVRGLAHDFNNLLSSVLANIQLARMDQAEGTHSYDRLNNAEDAVLRAKELSQQMLTYSGGSAPQTKTADIASLIQDVGTLTIRGSRSQVAFSLQGELFSVSVDEEIVRLILGDLFLFLDGSLQNGGTITVRAENVTSGSMESKDLRPADYLRISLCAPGLIIPEDELDEIFSSGVPPAFALDLSFAAAMARRSAGLLDVRSDTGSGTELVLYLPAHSHELPTKAATQQVIKKKKETDKKNILLMDDEEAILSATSDMLRFLGFEVATARDGEAAAECYRKALACGAPYDAVILDITVPGGLGAKETLPLLSAADPSVKVIISSGYSTNPMITDYRSFGFVAAIVKPYGFKELSEALSKVFPLME